jgi:hypothetical protein
VEPICQPWDAPVKLRCNIFFPQQKKTNPSSVHHTAPAVPKIVTSCFPSLLPTATTGGAQHAGLTHHATTVPDRLEVPMPPSSHHERLESSSVALIQCGSDSRLHAPPHTCSEAARPRAGPHQNSHLGDVPRVEDRERHHQRGMGSIKPPGPKSAYSPAHIRNEPA